MSWLTLFTSNIATFIMFTVLQQFIYDGAYTVYSSAIQVCVLCDCY